MKTNKIVEIGLVRELDGKDKVLFMREDGFMRSYEENKNSLLSIVNLFHRLKNSKKYKRTFDGHAYNTFAYK